MNSFLFNFFFLGEKFSLDLHLENGDGERGL